MSECRNLITDVPGIRIGHADDASVLSGVTVLLADKPLVAAVDVRGGGPGTRETDAVGLGGTVEEVHAIAISGGSAFGLSAASGVQSWLAEHGVGFEIGNARVPIVPQAVLFDLLNGGNKSWGPVSPYERLGREACANASEEFSCGSIGAGLGATTATVRGGLGSASEVLEGGLIVGAIVAVNAVGTATVGDTAHFWAAPFERDGEFGGLGHPAEWSQSMFEARLKGGNRQATTLAIVATNAKLSKREVHRLGVMAQGGLVRGLYPAHSPLDGDAVFSVATGDVPLSDPVYGLSMLGISAANVLARAIARGVYEAAPTPSNWSGPQAHRTVFPEAHRGRSR
jgi:L-aminopeptidase/D-esterase-like protein